MPNPLAQARPPLPPFTRETATEKVRKAEERLEQPRSSKRLVGLHA